MKNIEWIHSDILNEKYCRIKIDNRPDIYFFQKDFTNTCAMVIVKYGSVDIADKEPSGVAHFLEHKMFASDDGGDAFDLFAELGADANAYTSFDRTVYFFNCTQNFYGSFSELLKMINKPYFTDENVCKEQGIIAQEIGMYDDDPEYYCWQNLVSALYFHHPIKYNICGTVDSIKEITPELLYSVYKKYYHPSNLAIVICGNIDIDKVCELVKSNIFYENNTPIILNTINEPRYPKSKRVETHRNVSMPIFNIGYKDIAPSSNVKERLKKHIAISVLMRMFFSSSGMLYNELYDSQMITSSIYYSHDYGNDYSFVTLSGMANDPEKVCFKIDEYVNKVKDIGLDKGDFERSRRGLIADFISRFDSTEDIANNIAVDIIDEVDLFDEFEIIHELKIEDAEIVLREVFDQRYKSVSLVWPIDNIDKNERS